MIAPITCGHCRRRMPVSEWFRHRRARLDRGGCDVIGRMLDAARERRRAEHPMPDEVKAMLRERARRMHNGRRQDA